ncbi:MAG: hypothetical protein K1X91_10445 [Bacteriodetes bacterium]|nr:hypothetical protein [Bacteroidota bacterium]
MKLLLGLIFCTILTYASAQTSGTTYISKSTDSTNLSIHFGVLAGIGSHQGTRIGCYVDVYGFRFGGCKGYGVMAPLGFFAPLNGEYSMSLFLEIPLKLSKYINIGSSYAELKGFDIHDDQNKYVSVYINYERKLSRYVYYSFGFGIDELIYTSDMLGQYDGRESFHVDLKFVLKIF